MLGYCCSPGGSHLPGTPADSSKAEGTGLLDLINPLQAARSQEARGSLWVAEAAHKMVVAAGQVANRVEQDPQLNVPGV